MATTFINELLTIRRQRLHVFQLRSSRWLVSVSIALARTKDY